MGAPTRLTLFGTRLSPFVEKVFRALELKQLAFDFVEPRSPFDLRRWNPQTGKLPVLELDGERIWDSTRILRRLDALAPEPALVSADPRTAAAQRLLEDWADESLYWWTMAERWCAENRSATLKQLLDTLPAWARPLAHVALPRRLGRAPQAQGLGRLPRKLRLGEYARLLDDLVLQLGEGPFFFTDAPSVADLAVYAQLRTAGAGPTPELATLVEERPTLTAFLTRVAAAAANGNGVSMDSRGARA